MVQPEPDLAEGNHRGKRMSKFEKFIKWHKGMVEWFQDLTGWDDYTLLWFAFLEGVIFTLLLGYIL
jgi:hypothetical protein